MTVKPYPALVLAYEGRFGLYQVYKTFGHKDQRQWRTAKHEGQSIYYKNDMPENARFLEPGVFALDQPKQERQ